MAVTIEVGTNCYISYEDATPLIANELYTDSWDNATEEQRKKALIKATSKIENMKFRGLKADSDQVLQFPRALYSPHRVFNNIIDERKFNIDIGNGYWVETAISDRVKQATVSEALEILSQGSTANQRKNLINQGVKRFKLGNLEEEYNNNNSNSNSSNLLSSEALNLLKYYTSSSGVIV